MAREIPGWLPIRDAAEQYGLTYQALRRMVVEEKIFTRGNFTSTSEQAPIFIRVAELDAFRQGGVAAARRLKDAWAATEARLRDDQNPPGDPVFANDSPDLGGEGG